MNFARCKGGNVMFEFRIINTPDGNQIIDRNLRTPYNSLTPVQMVEYTEMDNRLALMDRMERKAKKKEEKKPSFASVLAHAMGML